MSCVFKFSESEPKIYAVLEIRLEITIRSESVLECPRLVTTWDQEKGLSHPDDVIVMLFFVWVEVLFRETKQRAECNVFYGALKIIFFKIFSN